MRILERKALQSVFSNYILTALSFCFLYIIGDAMGHLDEFIDRKVPFHVIGEYYMVSIPIILVQTSSIACLVAVLLSYGSLNNNNEIIVMRASGLNFWQITKPALLFGLLLSMFIFWTNENHVPHATERTTQIEVENMYLEGDRQKQKKAIKNLTFYGQQNRLYFIDQYNPTDQELKGVTILEYDKDANLKQKISASRGIWTGIAWKFYNSQVTSFPSTNIATRNKSTVKVYGEKLMDIKETPSDFFRQRLQVNAMNIKQLSDYIGRFKNSGAKKALNNLRVDFHQKIAFPFSNFVIILIGLPFAMVIKGRKRSTFASLGIAIFIGFLYYVADAVAIALGKGGALPPALCAWTAPIVFMGAAIIIIENNFQ